MQNPTGPKPRRGRRDESVEAIHHEFGIGSHTDAESDWRDLNPRPLDPQSSALPNCATARYRESYSPFRRFSDTANTSLQS